MDGFLEAAITEARKGVAAGGIPIGSDLLLMAKLLVEVTTNECKMEVQSCTQKWIVWKVRAELQQPIIVEQHCTQRYLPVICAAVQCYSMESQK